jgi:hypothetical protein
VITYPLPHNTQRLEDDIVKTLLETYRDQKAEYPPELYVPRRDAYLAQLETRMPGQAGTHPGGNGPIGDTVKARPEA